MNKAPLVLVLSFMILSLCFSGEPDKEIKLLIRGDDIGCSHAANIACINSYQNGIMRSVEIMPVCAWFPEAVKLLNENPGLDVGVHLALTSEWENIKWGPLTYAPSLVDENGYFFPMVWQREDFPPYTSLQKSDWKLEEIENELRAQIEMVIKHVPHVSHMGGHMGFSGLDPRIGELMNKLSQEYHFEVDFEKHHVKRFEGWGQAKSLKERINNFVKNLNKLEPGTYIFIDHPALDTPEMRAVYHKGYENVAVDRDWVTKVFTNKKVKNAVKKKNIKLISYKDLK
ncbi:ChbG/HpnK family deacetylase [candidate division KSB1 bacterium]|nr:ChbG/HpnK family deacetylase [candidate division KSB1 bacterium]